MTTEHTSVEPKTTKASSKKTYTEKERAEALRLIVEEGYTLDKVAAQMGCSLTSIQNWRKKAAKNSSAKITKKTTKKSVKKVAKPMKKAERPAASVSTTGIAPKLTFVECVQRYWSRYAPMNEIKDLPHDATTKVVQIINDTLLYMYDSFNEH